MKRKMYHVVTAEEIARNQAYEDAEEYDKVKLWHGALKIYPTDASVEMSITCQKTATAMRKFIKAYNQAANDGVIPQIMIEKIGDEIPTNDVETWEEMYGSIETDDVHEFVATARDVANYAHNGVYWRHERFEDSHYIFINIDTKFEEHRAEWLKKNSIMQEVDEETDGSEDDDDEETVLTEDYNFDNEDEDDELEDEEETRVEKVVTTAELEEQLKAVQEEIENNVDGVKSVIKRIKELNEIVLKHVAYCEDEIWKWTCTALDGRLKIDELNAKAAKLQAEIENRKLIENLVAASIQVEEKTVVAEPVTFEISRFGEEEVTVETDTAAVIDTAVTEVPIIDEDAEIAKKRQQIEKLKADNVAIRKQIEELEKLIGDNVAKIEDLEIEISNDIESIYNKYVTVCKKAVQNKMALIPQDEDDEDPLKFKLRKNWNITINHETGILWDTKPLQTYDRFCVKLYMGERAFNDNCGLTPLAEYSSLKSLKAAMDALQAAVEYGDKVFTFPADNAC